MTEKLALIHDIANAMTLIAGRLSILESKMGDCNDIAQDLRILNERAAMVVEMMQRLRLELKSDTPCRVDSTVMHLALVVKTIRRFVAGNERVVFSTGPLSGGMVSIERVNLERILLNLIGNALEAAPKNENVSVHAHTIHGKGKRCTLCRLPLGEEDFLAIEIKNSGELDTSAFLPGWSTKRNGEGSIHEGMGLGIVDTLVHRSGGHVLAEVSDGIVAVSVLLRVL